MVDFVSEVQEELRKDDYNKWLKQYGPYLLGLIVLVIVGTGYYEWKKVNDANLAEANSLVYIEASELAAEDQAAGMTAFLDISESAPDGYAGLSLIRAAQIELDNGNIQSAVDLLDRAASTFSGKRHSQLAQMKAAYALINESRYPEVITRMTPLTEKGEPYEYLARELLGFSAKETGDLQTARKHFSYLETIPGVPDTVQLRAKEHMMMMNLAEESQEEETPSPEPVILEETAPEESPMETQGNE